MPSAIYYMTMLVAFGLPMFLGVRMIVAPEAQRRRWLAIALVRGSRRYRDVSNRFVRIFGTILVLIPVLCYVALAWIFRNV